MKTLIQRLFRTRSGSVLGVVVVFLPATLGVMALAIDLAMLLQSRVQAQRAADSAALAGASAFIDANISAAAAPGEAQNRAYEYALLNEVRGTYIDSAEVTVSIRPADAEVWVGVRRRGIPTWFARFLGFPTGNVAAEATARASPASYGRCLKPIAIPDIWDENDITQDLNGDDVWDAGERWTFDPGRSDRYRQWQNNPLDFPPPTGYGSEFRNPAPDTYVNDRGRRMYIKPQRPQDAPTEGFFYPIQIDNTPGGGANDWRADMLGCDPTPIQLNAPILLEMGNMRGPANDIFTQILAMDPGATYDESTHRIINSRFANPLDSPRVLLFALFNPHSIAAIHTAASGSPGNNHYVTITDMALFFLESPGALQGNNYHQSIVGRFLQYAGGSGGGPGPGGTLVRVLQLVD